MGYLFFALLLALIAYFMFGRRDARSSSSPDHRQRLGEQSSEGVSQDRTRPRPIDYVKERWREAELERRSGGVSTFPAWFFDPATDRQLERLEADGTRFTEKNLTKGAASDLIGLKEPLDEDDVEVLRFFKVSLRGMSQTMGRYEVKRLMSVEENRCAWEDRPADAMQREYLKFFKIPAPKGLKHRDAIALMKTHGQETRTSDSAKTDEWWVFVNIVEELADADTREMYDIKKPSFPMIWKAIEAVRAEGEDAEDIDLVVEKLLELKPELGR